MPRSLRVAPKYIKQVKSALKRNSFPSQKALATELGISRATVSKFLNGKPVDYLNFVEISEKLGLDWQAIAGLGEEVSTESVGEIPQVGGEIAPSSPPESPENQCKALDLAQQMRS